MKSILEGKKKLLVATGAVVVAVSLALGVVLTDISKDTKAIESYPIIAQLEQSDFKRDIAKNESFESLLERNNLTVTNNTQSLTEDMNKIYQMYSLVWNAEYNNVDCRQEIESKITSFQEALLNLIELRVPGKITKVSDQKIEAVDKGKEDQMFISPEAYNRNWAYTGAEIDEERGGYIWKYTIEPTYNMTCEDEDLLFLLRASKEDAKFFTNKNILKAISAYIRVLGNEYQFVYDEVKEKDINDWNNSQKVIYKGKIINVTKTNNQSKSDLSEQLSSFKKYLLGLYSIEGISPDECKISKLEEKWYLIIDSTKERIELNDYCAQTCESIAAIQSMLRKIDTADYTESVTSEEGSLIMSYNVEEALDKVSDSYTYLK